MGYRRVEPAALVEHDLDDVSETDDVPAETDHDDFGGAAIDDISDDYPILDDGPRDDNVDPAGDRNLDDDLEQFIDDLNAVLDHFYNAGPDDNDIVNPDEPHTPGLGH